MKRMDKLRLLTKSRVSPRTCPDVHRGADLDPALNLIQGRRDKLVERFFNGLKFLRWGWLIPLILFLGCSSHSAGQIRQRDTKERTYYKGGYEKEFKGLRAEKKRLEVELKHCQEENQGLQREVKLQKRRVAKLEKRNLELEQKYVVVQEQEFSLKVSKLIRGRIIGLSRHSNLVIISPGKRDEIGPGVEFSVWRHNKRIGKIIVEKVEKDWSSGYSVKEAEVKPLQTGDAIALKIE